MRASLRLLTLSTALLAAAACSDSGSGTENNPAPSVSALNPASVEVGSPGITLSVDGGGFTEESAVLWGGASRATTFVSSSRLQIALAAADLDEAGTVDVTVRTPAPGGGTSAARTFTIEAPPVAAIDLTPGAATLVPGQTATLTAVLRSADGAELTDRTPSWSSSESSVASVSSGVVTGVAPGSAMVTASSEGVTAQAAIEVVSGGMALPEGSTISAGAVTLIVPAGAVSTARALTVTPDGSPPGNATIVDGTAVVLGPDGTTFDQPVTVDLGYDPSDLPAGVAAGDLFVARWDGSAWQPLADAAIDSVANRVTGTTTAFSPFAILADPPEWRRVTGHPGEGWAEHWGDWTVAAGRLWVVENDEISDALPRIHWTDDGVVWQSQDPEALGFPDLNIGYDGFYGNNLLATGTDEEVVIATSFTYPANGPVTGSLTRREIWVVRGTPGNWTVQSPANAPGLEEDQIPDDGQYRFSVSAFNGGRASWDDRVVLLPRSIWWYPFNTTDQSFLSLTSDDSNLWQMSAPRGYPWSVNGYQWMSDAAGTPWGFYAVGHIQWETEVWYSADGHLWDVVADPVDAFGGSREVGAQVWSGTSVYGPRGLLMARVRDTPSEQVVAWRTEDGQSWTEAVVDDEVFGDIRGFMAGDRYVLTAHLTNRLDSRFRPVWVSSDGDSWVRLPQGPDFDKIIGWGDRLWGFRSGEVWEFDLSRLEN